MGSGAKAFYGSHAPAYERCNGTGPLRSPARVQGKYRAVIARRNASDSAISPMPFMPSSMLTHP